VLHQIPVELEAFSEIVPNVAHPGLFYVVVEIVAIGGVGAVLNDLSRALHRSEAPKVAAHQLSVYFPTATVPGRKTATKFALVVAIAEYPPRYPRSSRDSPEATIRILSKN
jgi:hypothetical protein